ncbi:putative glutaredoxin-C2 [Hordeum vulgare]|nr:putative glutaredoxin-C2 [Hordeum vulgare]
MDQPCIRKRLPQSQIAPAWRRSGTSWPPTCSVMIWSVVPTSLPPMKTAGTGGVRPTMPASALSTSFPRGSLSSSCTVQLTPISVKSVFTAWHMQQLLAPKITTARCDASLLTLSAIAGSSLLP